YPYSRSRGAPRGDFEFRHLSAIVEPVAEPSIARSVRCCLHRGLFLLVGEFVPGPARVWVIRRDFHRAWWVGVLVEKSSKQRLRSWRWRCRFTCCVLHAIECIPLCLPLRCFGGTGATYGGGIFL